MSEKKTWAVRYTKIDVSEVIVEASGREEAKELAEKAELARDVSQETKVTVNVASYYAKRNRPIV